MCAHDLCCRRDFIYFRGQRHRLLDDNIGGELIPNRLNHALQINASLVDLVDMMELADYLDSQDMVEKFASYADKRGLKRRNLLIKKSHKLLDRVIDSRIIYNMLDEQAWTQYRADVSGERGRRRGTQRASDAQEAGRRCH